jgi:hydroxymethylpyrimidine/phosphomethylpyrimidine kinase
VGHTMTPIAVTIAGSDPSAGAGIQADLKTFSAMGVYGATVITSLTAQSTTEITAVEPVPAMFVAAQIDALFSDLDVAATKIGMLGSAAVVEAVAQGIARHGQTSIVLDPVTVASTGAALLAPGAVDALRAALLPLALIVTPNLSEAAALLDSPVASTELEMRMHARRLLALGARAVLIKGGHREGPESVDFFVDRTSELRLPAPRIPTRNTHGTGCTLSAAIAAALAKGFELPEAVAEAKAYVTLAIAAADRLAVGKGAGPLHHFHAWW